MWRVRRVAAVGIGGAIAGAAACRHKTSAVVRADSSNQESTNIGGNNIDSTGNNSDKRRPPVVLSDAEIDRIAHSHGFSRGSAALTQVNLWVLGYASKAFMHYLSDTRVFTEFDVGELLSRRAAARREEETSSPGASAVTAVSKASAGSDDSRRPITMKMPRWVAHVSAAESLTSQAKEAEAQDTPEGRAAALQLTLRALARLLAAIRDSHGGHAPEIDAIRRRAIMLRAKADELALLVDKHDKYQSMRGGGAGDSLRRAVESLEIQVSELDSKPRSDLDNMVWDESGRRRGLITASNHVSSLDDPLATAAIAPWHVLRSAKDLRWTFGATDHCFRNKPLTEFFRHVKVLPVTRGAGLDQYGLVVGSIKLDEGDWIHFYPEGTRNRRHTRSRSTSATTATTADAQSVVAHSQFTDAFEHNGICALRPGISKLITGAEITPVVVPMVHAGMERILPVRAPLPRPFKKVAIIVGRPLDFSTMVYDARMSHMPEAELNAKIAAHIEAEMVRLRVELWQRLSDVEGHNLPIPEPPRD